MGNRTQPKLYIVVPCYNEEEVLPITAPNLKTQLLKMISAGLIEEDSKIVFVNDGSTDQTYRMISELSASDTYFAGICLSRNRGHQNALLAGLMECKEDCDITISIDCDEQDDITVMEDMVRAYLDGNEIVYGVRNNRDSDSFLKRATAQGCYRFLAWMGAEVIYNHADYRLISSRALRELEKFGEVNLYLRGMIPMLGFKYTTVEYRRTKRIAGKSHYSVSKMCSLAFNGITNLSVAPLKMIMSMGILIAMVSFAGVIWAILEVVRGNTVSGWASTTCIICFVSGVQLISLGVIGEYVGKIYKETKRRPRYIISEKTGWKQAEREEKE